MSDANITRRLVIHGRVQGVYFRDSMRQQARKLGVNGWVRNRVDGTVEAMVHGEPDAVETIIEWAKEGPTAARVSEVRVKEAEGTFDGFEVLPTP
ncbi:MAG: acylphosphatase [Betaproteobacteria bacterium]|nr:MAG: acylphosphatase [Betaproteobacteria bacterium]